VVFHYFRRLPIVLLFLSSIAWAEGGCLLDADIIDEAEINGLSDDQSDIARSYLKSLLEDKDERRIRRDRLTPLFSQGSKLIAQSLSAQGYFNATIESRSLCQEELRLIFDVDRGPRVIVSEVSAQLTGHGAQNPELIQLFEKIYSLQYSPLDQVEYERLKGQLLNAAAALGYFDAQFEQVEVQVNRDTNTAKIQWRYNTGARYRFGKIDIYQQVLSSDVFNRYIKFKEGDFYDVRNISQLQSDLYASGFFSVVDVQAPPNREAKVVPMQLTMEPAKLNKISIGLGYSTDEGERGSLSWTRRWLNYEGDSMRFDSKYSNHEKKAIVTYSQLGEDPATESNYYRVGYARSNYEYAYGKGDEPIWLLIDSARRFAQIGWIKKSDLWTLNNFVQLQEEAQHITHDDNSRIDTLLIYPGINLHYLNTDDLFRPTHGISLDLSARAGAQALGEGYNFLYLSAKGTYTTKLAEDHQLTMRAWAGSNFFANSGDLASNFRFYMGGDSNVRGYKYREIGPVTGNYLTGGESQIGFSAEYEYFFSEDIAAAAFYDIGDAFNDQDINLKDSVGVGLHWYSPVGPVKLEYAQPMDMDETPLLHIMIRATL